MRHLALALALGCRATITIPSAPVADAAPDAVTDVDARADRAALGDAGAEDRVDATDAADALGPCAPGRTRCGAECVDLLRDSLHCGECGHACGDDPRGGRWRCVSDGAAPGSAACGSDVVDMALGDTHICIVRRQGDVQCWGHNFFGQLGDGSTRPREVPTFVTGLGGVRIRHVFAGPRHTCATTEGGAVTYCWGDNESGQLGIGIFGGTEPVTLRMQVMTLSSVSGLSVGEDHACAVDGSVLWCWGYNDRGQLGDGGNNRSAVPVRVSTATGLSRGADIAAGSSRTCALDEEGAAWCWGADNGLLGAGEGRGSSNVAVRVQGITGRVVQIVAGQGHACARRQTGASYCWGRNGSGALGDGTMTDRAVATPVVDIQNLKWLFASASGGHTCAVDEQNRIYCWGRNDAGQLGDGTTANRLRPTRAALDPRLNFQRVYLGNTMTCGLTTTFDAIWCWGELGAIEPTVAARGPGSTRVLTPLRLTTAFPARDGGV